MGLLKKQSDNVAVEINSDEATEYISLATTSSPGLMSAADKLSIGNITDGTGGTLTGADDGSTLTLEDNYYTVFIDYTIYGYVNVNLPDPSTVPAFKEYTFIPTECSSESYLTLNGTFGNSNTSLPLNSQFLIVTIFSDGTQWWVKSSAQN